MRAWTLVLGLPKDPSAEHQWEVIPHLKLSRMALMSAGSEMMTPGSYGSPYSRTLLGLQLL